MSQPTDLFNFSERNGERKRSASSRSFGPHFVQRCFPSVARIFARTPNTKVLCSKESPFVLLGVRQFFTRELGNFRVSRISEKIIFKGASKEISQVGENFHTTQMMGFFPASTLIRRSNAYCPCWCSWFLGAEIVRNKMGNRVAENLSKFARIWGFHTTF